MIEEQFSEVFNETSLDALAVAALRYICVCVCVCVSVSPCLCISLSLCISVSLRLSVPLCTCLSVCGSVCISLSLALCHTPPTPVVRLSAGIQTQRLRNDDDCVSVEEGGGGLFIFCGLLFKGWWARPRQISQVYIISIYT